MTQELNNTDVWLRWMADFYSRNGMEGANVRLLSTVSVVVLVLIAA